MPIDFCIVSDDNVTYNRLEEREREKMRGRIGENSKKSSYSA